MNESELEKYQERINELVRSGLKEFEAERKLQSLNPAGVDISIGRDNNSFDIPAELVSLVYKTAKKD